MTRVRVSLEIPDSLVKISRWALESLLFPLGVRPAWVERGAASADICYGAESGGTRASITLPCAPQAADVHGRRLAVDASSVEWRDFEGDRSPVFFQDALGRPDLVAGTWFLLSGWQEITSRSRDEKGRFRFSDSLQAKLSFAGLPVVDAYREEVARTLERAGFRLHRRTWGNHEWTMCPTVDVDYLRKWRKGMVYREVVENLLLNRRDDSGSGRLRRARTFAADFLRPGDVYRESLVRMVAGIRSAGGTGTVFLKSGAHGPHDVAYSLNGRFVRRFVSEALESGFEVGLHPSYHASTHGGYMNTEAELLRRAVGTRVRSVRQHYLRYEHPITLRLQSDAGFEIDSTLGFAEHEGFRRGTCVPFRIFDVYADRTTSLWEMPLAVMDGALFNRRMLSPSEAVNATIRVMETCRRFRGSAVILWHSILWDDIDAPGWHTHFHETLASARDGNALMASLSSALDAWRGSP